MEKTRKERLSFPLRLPTSLKLLVAELARRDGVSVNEFISIALAEKASRMTAEPATAAPSALKPQQPEQDSPLVTAVARSQ